MQPYSIPENCDFAKIIEGGFGRDGGGLPGKNSCTPIIHDLKFLGIVINAPKEVRINTTGVGEVQNTIPLCGIISHDLGTYIDGNASVVRSIIIVVTDLKSNETWSGKMPGPDNVRARPPATHGNEKKYTREEMKGRIVRQAFNPNLLDITDMALRETEYIVYASAGLYKSNVVTIKVVEGKA